jgi:hypothetical protein
MFQYRYLILWSKTTLLKVLCEKVSIVLTFDFATGTSWSQGLRTFPLESLILFWAVLKDPNLITSQFFLSWAPPTVLLEGLNKFFSPLYSTILAETFFMLRSLVKISVTISSVLQLSSEQSTDNKFYHVGQFFKLSDSWIFVVYKISFKEKPMSYSVFPLHELPVPFVNVSVISLQFH